MSWANEDNARRRLLLALSVVSLAASGLWFGANLNATTANSDKSVTDKPVVQKSASVAPAATFPANTATLGPIPDNNPATPRDVTFTVSGISGVPTNVEVSHTYGGPGLTVGHTWVGDMNVFLIAPNGNSFVIYGRTGQVGTNAGDSSDLSGPYNFKDSATGTNWWAAAFAAGATAVVPPGDYRTTASGPQPASNTSPVTNLTAAFSGVTNANGTWTMRFTDNAGGDTGAVMAASLTLTGAAVTPTKPNADFTGDGKTDYSQARDVSPTLSENEFLRAGSVREKQRILLDNPPAPTENLAPGTNMRWFINNSSSLGTNTITNFGEPISDFVVPSDYDGDGKADIAIWRVGAPTVAAFYILRSTNMTIRTELFGQTGDDPAITGDYDGDGKSDVAVQRCPPIGSPGQCFFFYRGSFNNPSGNVTYVEWGFGQMFDLFASPGDFDGDGKFDFCIQRTHPNQPGNGQFVLLRSSDFGVEYINWGRNTDIIVPGDYDGDGKYDFMVSRTEDLGQGSGRSYYLLTRTGGGTGAVPIRWGIAGDIRTPGDFDGDAITDIAIWRPTAGSGTSTYYVRRSSDLTLQQFQYGLQGDAAVPNWVVH